MIELKRREGLLADYKQKMGKYQGDDRMLSKIKKDHDLELKKWAVWEEQQRLIIQNMAQMLK